VTNAFVNADIETEIYMRIPLGYRKGGVVYRLRKALYSLRQAPLLWQRHFTTTLNSLRFSPILHEPCCYRKDGVLVFFYVDDIVIAFEKGKRQQVDTLIRSLKSRYKMTGGGDLQWFLGIEVIRDRRQQTIQLSQATFVDKITKLVLDSSASATLLPSTPMRTIELLPYDGQTIYSSINQYQKKIGSLLYTAINTRLDIAFATLRLARFNVNPSPEHYTETDRTIRYLVGTRNLAL